MPGLLDILKAAAGPAAGARASYLEGAGEEADKQAARARQSTLDAMKARMDQSTIDENASRGHYWDSFAEQKENPSVPVQNMVDKDGNVVQVPRRVQRSTLERLQSGATGGRDSSPVGATGPAAPLSFSVTPESITDRMRTSMGLRSAASRDDSANGGDTSGAVGAPSIVDQLRDTQAGQQTGPASGPTGQRPGRVPGLQMPVKSLPPARIDPNSNESIIAKLQAKISADSAHSVNAQKAKQQFPTPTAAGRGGAGGGRPMSPAATETYLNKVAMDALRAAHDDPTVRTTNADGSPIPNPYTAAAAAKVANDPDGQRAFALGLATRHFTSAEQQFNHKAAIDADVHSGAVNVDGTAKTPAQVQAEKAARIGGRGASGGGGSTAAASGGTKSTKPSADPKIEAAVGLVTSGVATLDQLDATTKWTPAEKAEIRRRVVANKPDNP